MEVKTCSKCDEEKPTSEFGKRKDRPDGLQYHCKACKKASNSAHYKANAEKVKATTAKRAVEKKDEIRAYRIRYEKENAEEIALRQRARREEMAPERAAYHRKYRQENKATVNALSRRYKASKIKRTPSWANEQAIRAFYEEAARLEQETGIKYHVDHIIPLQGELVSGLHVENNLQVIPANENLSKSNHYEVA